MQKGQVFSLDFLISLVAVVVAVGLMLQAVEVNTYAQKEERLYNEMEMVAETAADLIALGSDTTCTNASGANIVNCVDTSMPTPNAWGGKVIDAFHPGLNPSGYKYEISCGGVTRTSPGPPWASEDFYEVQRAVSTSVGGMPETLFVRVWK